MSGLRSRVPQRAGATVALILFAVLSTPAQAAKPDSRVKPDLVVTGKPEVSPDGPSDGRSIGLASEVTNKKQRKKKGDKAAPETKPAGPSETSLLLSHPPQVRNQVAVSQAVPALKPDESHSGHGRRILRGFPPGEYTATVCADQEHKVKERNEQNNCTGIGKVYVTIFNWLGSFDGVGPVEPGLDEEWGSDDADLVQLVTGEEGRFEYVFTGNIHYSISGSDADGCVYGGAGTMPIPFVGDGLTLDYHKGEYWGNQGLGGDRPFAWTVSCPGGGQETLEGPFDFAGAFIVVDPIDAKPMPFGTTHLTDTSTEVIDGLRYIWNWDLHAAPSPP